jgi:hypothetical protein
MTPRRNSFCCQPPACSVATRCGCAATGVSYPGWSQYFLNDAPMSRRPWLHRIQCVRCAVLCCGMAADGLRALRTAGRWFAGRCCWCGRLGRPKAAAALAGRTVQHAGGRAVQCGWYGEAGDCATLHAACCTGTRRSMRCSSSTRSTRASPTAATPRRGVPSLTLSLSGPIRPDSHEGVAPD